MAEGRTSAGPRLLDQVREAIRVRHYSYRTEQEGAGDRTASLDQIERSRRPKRLPVVLSRTEIREVLRRLNDADLHPRF